jgi:hypothetical protein
MQAVMDRSAGSDVCAGYQTESSCVWQAGTAGADSHEQADRGRSLHRKPDAVKLALA